MATAFERLAKILELERKGGYKNRAVIGGLEKFLPGWAAGAVTEPGGAALVERVNAALAGYADRTAEQRAAVVRALLASEGGSRGAARSAADAGSGHPTPPPPAVVAADDEDRDDEPRPTAPSRARPQVPPAARKSERGARSTTPTTKSGPAGAASSTPRPPTEPKSHPKAPPTPPQGRRPSEPSSSDASDGGLSMSAAPVAVADPPPLPRVQTVRRGPAPTIPATGDLDGPVSQIPGVSSVYARRLEKLHVHTIRDMLYLIPRRHDDFSRLKTIHQLVYGEEATVVGTVQNTTMRRTQRGLTVTTTVVSDATGSMQATFFNQPYLLQQLRPGRQIVLSGRVEAYLGRLLYQSPEWEPLDQDLVHTARLVPVYPLTEGIGPRWIRNVMKRVVDAYAPRLPDPLPPDIRQAQRLLPLSDAVRQAHFPDSAERLGQARHRLAFDEFFVIQLGVLRQRRLWRANDGRALPTPTAALDSFMGALPFGLTGAQQRVLGDILQDMAAARPMSRLLQGDVGSGKTVVAAATMLAAHANGAQAALMAPTEILAEQHARGLQRMFDRWAEVTDQPTPEVVLLTGSLTASERSAAYAAVASGAAPFVVGTHAVIQSGVEFANLGLAIVDEQHRFGVGQRATLRQKGATAVPHLLVMTATPIPRTLALTLYGDLDLSIIDEMPPGRTPIKTKWVTPRERERAYAFVDAQVRQGRQAFVICPLIEESENMETRAAVQEYERLQQYVFPHLRLGLLHGKMKPADKEAAMAAFYAGETQVLVSTSVVEVGIDVPNATVMFVEGANRFGLAQLHQFRGRVGRGEHQSYCLLVADEEISDVGKTRLEAMERTQNGFELAEEDLKLRGPGEFFGTRQSGLPDLVVAQLSDVATLEQARGAAEELFARDSDLSAPDHQGLRAAIDKFWAGEGDLS